jgi:hypothetical protein
MRSFLINKNLSLYYLLRRKIGKKQGLVVASTIEKAILILGREKIPVLNKNGGVTEKQKLE